MISVSVLYILLVCRSLGVVNGRKGGGGGWEIIFKSFCVTANNGSIKQ